MFERLTMLMRVGSLYVRRQKRLDLLKQVKASDLSEKGQERIIDIMQRMRIIREADLQALGSSDSPPLPLSSSASKAHRQSKG